MGLAGGGRGKPAVAHCDGALVWRSCVLQASHAAHSRRSLCTFGNAVTCQTVSKVRWGAIVIGRPSKRRNARARGRRDRRGPRRGRPPGPEAKQAGARRSGGTTHPGNRRGSEGRKERRGRRRRTSSLSRALCPARVEVLACEARRRSTRTAHRSAARQRPTSRCAQARRALSKAALVSSLTWLPQLVVKPPHSQQPAKHSSAQESPNASPKRVFSLTWLPQLVVKHVADEARGNDGRARRRHALLRNATRTQRTGDAAPFTAPLQSTRALSPSPPGEKPSHLQAGGVLHLAKVQHGVGDVPARRVELRSTHSTAQHTQHTSGCRATHTQGHARLARQHHARRRSSDTENAQQPRRRCES